MFEVLKNDLKKLQNVVLQVKTDEKIQNTEEVQQEEAEEVEDLKKMEDRKLNQEWKKRFLKMQSFWWISIEIVLRNVYERRHVKSLMNVIAP